MKWINAKKRFPKINQVVLTIKRFGGDSPEWSELTYYDMDFGSPRINQLGKKEFAWFKGKDVLYWLALPKPPKL